MDDALDGLLAGLSHPAARRPSINDPNRGMNGAVGRAGAGPRGPPPYGNMNNITIGGPNNHIQGHYNNNVPNALLRQRHPMPPTAPPLPSGLARYRVPSGGLRKGGLGVPAYSLSVNGSAAGAGTSALPPPSAAPAMAILPLSHGFADEQNARFRKHMEDEHTAVANFADRLGSLYCGLYDGHGGRTAVEFVKSHLHATIERELRSGSPGEAPLDAIKRGFLKLDRMLLQIGALHCGTTAAVCLCLPGRNGAGIELHAANVGDSRIVLVGEGGQPARRLSIDHVATDPDEVRRVQRDGGHVVGNRVGGSLAITRALGDHVLKGEDGGVTAEPHCVIHQVGANDRFVVMASDGIWDVMSDDDAQELVLANEALSNDELATCVVRSALARGTRDNLSVLIVRLR